MSSLLLWTEDGLKIFFKKYCSKIENVSCLKSVQAIRMSPCKTQFEALKFPDIAWRFSSTSFHSTNQELPLPSAASTAAVNSCPSPFLLWCNGQGAQAAIGQLPGSGGESQSQSSRPKTRGRIQAFRLKIDLMQMSKKKK